MAKCPGCDNELVGMERICKTCFEEQYTRTGQREAWRERVTAGNALVLLVLFTLGFVLERTFFSHIYRHPMGPKTAAVTALLAVLFVIAFGRR